MTYAELAALQAKRSKTFSEAQVEAMATYCQAEHDLKEMQAENAKLRELVRAMATRLAYADRVVDGGVFDARLRREVAKLGVEVDD